MIMFITFMIFILVLSFFWLFVMGTSLDEQKEKIIKKLSVSVSLSTILLLYFLYNAEISPEGKYIIALQLTQFAAYQKIGMLLEVPKHRKA